MEKEKVNTYLMVNGKYFDNAQLSLLRDQLIRADEEQFSRVQLTQFKDPTVSLIVSILVGQLGVDRILIGDVGMGIAKLLTCGGLGVWWLVDLFLIMDATKEKNMLSIQQALA